MSQSATSPALETASLEPVAQPAAPKLFGVLNEYGQRVIYANTLEDIEECIHSLSGGKEVAIQDETFGEEDGEVFKYVDLPKGRVYLFLIPHPGAAHAVTKKIFELTSHVGSSSIVYIHHSAIAMLVKLTTLQNFPTILLHNKDEAHSYLSSEIVFNSERELVYSLAQKQRYLETKILPRDEFYNNKVQNKERRGNRRDDDRPARREDAPREKREYRPRNDEEPRQARATKKTESRPATTRKPLAPLTRKTTNRPAAQNNSSWDLGQDDEEIYVPPQDEDERPRQNAWKKTAPPKKAAPKKQASSAMPGITPKMLAMLARMAELEDSE